MHVLNVPIICEGFAILYLAAQYMSPLLTLAFTTERFIAIKFPLRRPLYCTVHRAVCTSFCIVLTSMGLCGIQGYLWSYDSNIGECILKQNDLWEKWSWGTEMFMFLCVPLLVLLLNILVILEIKKSSKVAFTLNKSVNKTTATTVLLLAVSFYLILTTLPASIVFLLQKYFPPGNLTHLTAIETDNNWQVYFQYCRARKVIEIIGRTHFVMNVYIYILAGDRFRKEVLNVLQCKSSR
ncbi:uncharacterized protein LOC127878495 [Dreissena polymorpha]|nr:uncharacterized protein LOC127878495 [Dreissena polymorpha]